MTPGTSHDSWPDRLSAYLDDELSPVERRRLDLHLETCPACRSTLESLRQVTRLAPGLAVDAEPERDLWPGISGRLTPGRIHWWRRVPMPWHEPLARPLAYAAAVITVVAIGVGLLRVRNGPAPFPGGTAATPTPGAPAAISDEAYYDRVADLKRAVRANLTADPRVIEILDRNLDSLNVAISDYRDALSRNPDDARLRERFESARRRQLEMLQHAAALATGEGD